MIVRVVRLSFRPDAVAAFLALFEERKMRIRNFPGCRHLALWQDVNEPGVYCTYSHWDSEAALDKYRFSAFFKETWALTRAGFAAPPVAWSVTEVVVVPQSL